MCRCFSCLGSGLDGGIEAVTVPLWIQFPGWFSRDAAAFELHGDFESCFIRRVSHKLSGGEDSRRCLPRGLHPRSLHQIPHWRPNERGISKNILTTRRHARARVWIGDPSVVRFHWSRRLTRDHLSIVSLHYIFDSNMSNALARSTHKNPSQLCMFQVADNQLKCDVANQISVSYSISLWPIKAVLNKAQDLVVNHNVRLETFLFFCRRATLASLTLEWRYFGHEMV